MARPHRWQVWGKNDPCLWKFLTWRLHWLDGGKKAEAVRHLLELGNIGEWLHRTTLEIPDIEPHRISLAERAAEMHITGLVLSRRDLLTLPAPRAAVASTIARIGPVMTTTGPFSAAASCTIPAAGPSGVGSAPSRPNWNGGRACPVPCRLTDQFAGVAEPAVENNAGELI
jgi:hypothetical protein